MFRHRPVADCTRRARLVRAHGSPEQWPVASVEFHVVRGPRHARLGATTRVDPEGQRDRSLDQHARTTFTAGVRVVDTCNASVDGRDAGSAEQTVGVGRHAVDAVDARDTGTPRRALALHTIESPPRRLVLSPFASALGALLSGDRSRRPETAR